MKQMTTDAQAGRKQLQNASKHDRLDDRGPSAKGTPASYGPPPGAGPHCRRAELATPRGRCGSGARRFSKMRGMMQQMTQAACPGWGGMPGMGVGFPGLPGMGGACLAMGGLPGQQGAWSGLARGRQFRKPPRPEGRTEAQRDSARSKPSAWAAEPLAECHGRADWRSDQKSLLKRTL